MTPTLAPAAAPAHAPNLTPRDAADWLTSVAAVRACDDAGLAALVAALDERQADAGLAPQARALLTLARSERAIRRVEAALAVPLETP